MKVIIDISEEDYNDIIDDSEMWTINMLVRLYFAVHDGKVISDNVTDKH